MNNNFQMVATRYIQSTCATSGEGFCMKVLIGSPTTLPTRLEQIWASSRDVIYRHPSLRKPSRHLKNASLIVLVYCYSYFHFFPLVLCSTFSHMHCGDLVLYSIGT